MARLVAAFGSSHSIMLVSQREDWQHNFKLIDPKNAHYYDKQGNKTDYDALLAAAPAGSEAMVTPEKMGQRYDAAEAAMDQLHERIKAAKLDLLLIVGDDQTELFRPSNNPAIAIYYGPTIRNTAREPASPSDSWVKSARMWRHEPEQDREYPVKSDLAEWLIRQLCDRDFDIAALDSIEPGKFEGHAFQFIHRRILKDHELPVIPGHPQHLRSAEPADAAPLRGLRAGAARADRCLARGPARGRDRLRRPEPFPGRRGARPAGADGDPPQGQRGAGSTGPQAAAGR